MKLYEEWLEEKRKELEDEFDGGASKEDTETEIENPHCEIELGAPEQFNKNDDIYMEPAIPQNAGLTPEPVYRKKVTSLENMMHNRLAQNQKKTKYAHY